MKVEWNVGDRLAKSRLAWASVETSSDVVAQTVQLDTFRWFYSDKKTVFVASHKIIIVHHLHGQRQRIVTVVRYCYTDLQKICSV